MDKEIFGEIIKQIAGTTNEAGSYAKFESSKYKPYRFSKNYFKQIVYLDSGKRVGFIDGGNVEVLKGPNFSLQLIRVYYTIYSKNKRIDSKKFELLLLVSSKIKKGEIGFETRTFSFGRSGVGLGNYFFSSLDESIKQGSNRVSVTSIGMIYRRFCEIKIAEHIADGLVDVVVLDGDLHAKFTSEPEVFEGLYKKARERKVVVCGLSKTSELMTETGFPLLSAVGKMAKEKGLTEWYYNPIVKNENKNHKAEIFVIKLLDRSEYCFRLDVFSKVDYNISEIMSLLRKNSTDPSFFGYPYGLIEAHMFSRCSRSEREILLARLRAYAGKNVKDIDGISRAVSAHGVLDRV